MRHTARACRDLQGGIMDMHVRTLKSRNTLTRDRLDQLRQRALHISSRTGVLASLKQEDRG